MTPAAAAQLLSLPAEATPDQLEARFLELRAKLEDKIAKAPTPGLKAKYRESLEQITEAFETLTLAADGSALPVVQKSKVERPESKVGSQSPPSSPRSSTVDPRPSPVAPKKSGGNKEFVIVALIAVILLASGGWFVMKTRAENAEKERIAAEAQAEADRLAEVARQEAEAEKARLAEERRLAEIEKQRLADEAAAEAQRLDQLGTRLRAELAELSLTWEIIEREERTTEKELSDLRSEQRSLRDPTPGEMNEINVRLDAMESYADWLSDFLLRHPVRLLQVRANELVSARAFDDAAPLVTQLREQLNTLEPEITRQRRESLAITGDLTIDSAPAGLAWSVVDAFGKTYRGVTPATVTDLGRGAATVTIARPWWPERTGTVQISPGGTATFSADFPSGGFAITANVVGAEVYARGQLLGQTPLNIAAFPLGQIEFEIRAARYLPATLSGKVTEGDTLTLAADLEVKAPSAEEQIAAFTAKAAGQWRHNPQSNFFTYHTFTRGSPRVATRSTREALGITAVHGQGSYTLSVPDPQKREIVGLIQEGYGFILTFENNTLVATDLRTKQRSVFIRH